MYNNKIPRKASEVAIFSHFIQVYVFNQATMIIFALCHVSKLLRKVTFPFI